MFFFHLLALELNDLKTGDIILFGDNRIILKGPYKTIGEFLYLLLEETIWEIAITIYARYWYHVALVVDRADIPEEIKLPEGYQKFILESRLLHGVVINPIEERLKVRPERIALRCLTPPLNKNASNKIKEALKRFYYMPFEKNFWEFVGSFIDFPFFPENEPNLTTLSCPEVIGETLKMAGILDDEVHSNELVPDNFAMYSEERKNGFFWKYNDPLKLKEPYKLSKEVILKEDYKLFIEGF